MERRPAAYQPSSAAESEDSNTGQNLSTSRRLTSNRASKQWYDAATTSPFAQLRHRRLGISVDSSNLSSPVGVSYGSSLEPTTSRFAIAESFPSTDDLRTENRGADYSCQQLRERRDDRYSFSCPQITSTHNLPDPSIDPPISWHQPISSVPAVLPKKRPLPFSAYNETFTTHSTQPKNEERVSYEEDSLPSSSLSQSSKNVKYVQQVPSDPMNSTSHILGDSLSVGRYYKRLRSDITEGDNARSHYATSTSERRNISGTDHFNTIGPSQNYNFKTKGSLKAKERFQQSVYLAYHSPVSIKKGFPSPLPNTQHATQDLLLQPSPMYSPTEEVNYHCGNLHPFSGIAHNPSSIRSDYYPHNTSENTLVNLPQKEEVPLSLLQQELFKRDIEAKSTKFLKPPDNTINHRNPTLVQGPNLQNNSKVVGDAFHSSNFSSPYYVNNISCSTNIPSYDLSPVRQQKSLGRNSPLNFSSQNFPRSKFDTGKHFGSATLANNEFSENSNSSQSFLITPISRSLPTSESSANIEIHEKHIHSIQRLSNQSMQNVESKSSEVCEMLSSRKNSGYSVSGVNLGDRISNKILHKHPLSKDTLKVERSCSDRRKTLKSAESSRRRRRRAVGLVCGVCGDSARSLHFGGVSCDSCKAFFRRAVIAKAYPSFLCVTTGLAPKIETRALKFGIGETDFDLKGDCSDSRTSSPSGKHKAVANRKELEKGSVDSSTGGRLKNCPQITITTRKYCQSCRFQKCIDIGMEISWVTMESDVNRRVPDHNSKSNESQESILKHGLNNKGSAELEDDERGTCKKDPNFYLTKSQQRQIENLVEIYRSVFWGVPEPVYHRPALVDFPPPFSSEDTSTDRDRVQKKSSEPSTDGNDSSNDATLSGENVDSKIISSSEAVKNQPATFLNSLTTEAGGKSKFLPIDAWHLDKLNDTFHLCFGSKKMTNPIEAESNVTCETSQRFDCEEDSHSNPQIPSYILEESQLSTAEIEHIRNLPQDPLGVNMYRKALRRRPRPWLIRQLMGYTLRFMHVVLKVLHGVGRSLSVSDRTILLRQGMTRLTFLNSVIMYDTSIEAWPERIFPSLPLVLQDGESGFISEQHEYLHGVSMHPDEVATVVAPDVLENQLLFIRGIKALVGSDFPSMFLLMAIMLFDSTEAGLEQPEIVEQIQSNYCYLLKQYLRWKFHDGPPPNPGDERHANFSLSPSTIVTKNRSLDPESTDSNDRSNGESNPRSASFTFEKEDGYYFSPPYPPSPTSSKAIFPLLLTKLADLQQTAHNYSSTPFILQGPEVDEIDNLVARIQVFMSDILTAGPSSVNDDEGGSGDSGGMGGNVNFQESSGDMDEVSRNKRNYFGGNDGGKPSSFGKELKNKLPENDDLSRLNWVASSGQDLSWDSCSSKDDDEYSGSSLSVVSMGESIDEIVGAFISSDGAKTEMQCDNDENLVRSLEFWDEREFLKLSGEASGESLVQGEMGSFGERELLLQKEHVLKYKTEDISLKHFREGNFESIGRESQQEKLTSMNSQFRHNSSSIIGKGLDKDSLNPHVEPSGQVVLKENLKNHDSELKLLEKESSIPFQRTETSELQGITKEEASFTCHNSVIEETKYSYSAEGMIPGANIDTKDKCKTTSNRSFWDCIKATGRAILGFGSLQPDSRSENDLLQPMTSLQDEKYLDNLLEHVERPESNSSGYVSSPSPLSMMKDFEPLHNGADWEDLFQRL